MGASFDTIGKSSERGAGGASATMGTQVVKSTQLDRLKDSMSILRKVDLRDMVYAVRERPIRTAAIAVSVVLLITVGSWARRELVKPPMDTADGKLSIYYNTGNNHD